MRKSYISMVLAAGMAITPLATAQAQTSIACMYMLMRVYKAELDHCSVPLRREKEERYQRLRTSMEKFIRANAKNDPDKILSNIETNNIKRALAGLTSCRSDDFKFAVQAMDQMTTPDHEKMVQGTLLLPRDPMQGACGT